jgi:hypothetical protein
MTINYSWVTDELPPQHVDMIFFYPDCKRCNFYFLKENSKISILNDPSVNFYKILKGLRDNEQFLKKLSKLNFNLKTFKKEKQKKSFKSELEESINSYVLYKFSSNNNLKDYKKNADCKNSLCSDIKELSKISFKIEKNNTFIYKYSLIEALKLFNNEDIVIYYSPTIKEINSTDHKDVMNILLKQHSKVIIHSYENKIYKKFFKNWTKKRKPGQKNKNKIECIWKNFNN